MNILVAISRTPETTAKVAFKDQKVFDEDGVSFIMNPYDEWYALVRALELKEQLGGQVDVVHVGTAASDPVIRKALAIGADKAIRVDAEATDARFTATQIAAVAKSGGYEVIMMGKETIDYNGNLVGSMVAELLDLPFVSYVSAMDSDGSAHEVTRDVEGGVEVLKIQGGLVISAAKGLAEQRIPNMRGIMMAKRKPLDVVPATPASALSAVVKFELPPTKSEVVMVNPEDMDELVRLLSEDAKVL